MKIGLLILCALGPIFCFAASPNQILEKADSYRNPSESYEMNILVEADGKTQVFQVFLRGKEKTLIVTKEPARDRGRNMLMLGRDFHAYVPNLKRSMRLSLAQKLSGQVSNGDIARTRWAGDYDVQIESQNQKEIQLLLKGNKDNLTYANIRLWVDSKTYKPLRTEYLALNAKTVLKKAWFEDYKDILGELRPSRIRIEDTGGEKSEIKIQSMKNLSLKEDFFTVRQMESMK